MATTLWSRTLDFISPRRCAVCGGRLSLTEHAVCTVCCLRLPRTGFCLTPSDNPVARLFWGQAAVERAAALFYYEARSETSRLIYALKYRGRPDIGVALGRQAAVELAAAGFLAGIDVAVPVPLARRRQRERGYNQSEAIARGVSSATGLPVEARAVVRTLYRGSQTELSRQERLDNVEGAFCLKDSSRLEGRHVLLIDDVVTTGATAIACATAMARVPGIRISFMALGFSK